MLKRAQIRFRAKIIVTSLPRDIYSACPKNNATIKFTLIYSNPYVIIVLQYRSICLNIRDSKMKGVLIKILGRATLEFTD